MVLDLLNFYRMFPNYDECRGPMWSNYEDKSDRCILSIAVPGYDKEDFELFVESGKLFLRITSGEQKLLYSILSWSDFRIYEFEEAEAEYKKGILTIVIPRVVKGKDQKTISIKISENLKSLSN